MFIVISNFLKLIAALHFKSNVNVRPSDRFCSSTLLTRAMMQVLVQCPSSRYIIWKSRRLEFESCIFPEGLDGPRRRYRTALYANRASAVEAKEE